MKKILPLIFISVLIGQDRYDPLTGERIPNKKFDPNFHQAMSEIENNEKDPGTILHEIQAGYMMGDRLLRPALVSVAKKKSSKDEENKDKKDEK